MNCRHCDSPLSHVFLDLGFAPPSNAYLCDRDLRAPEVWLPLKLYVCDRCWLVQTEDYTRAEDLFRSDYAYFSSTSCTWLEHAQRYADEMRQRLELNSNNFVVEIASNDGYLLKNFVAANIPCLGIEPTGSTARAAEELGIPVLRAFFNHALAQCLAADGKQADLLIGNNVYAHVPDINDFTAGLKTLLKPGGTITLEFPHLLRLIEQAQFDTVYHEHYSYLSLHTVRQIFARAGLRVWDVEALPTHGGSLRIFGCHENDPRAETSRVAAILAEEHHAGLQELAIYRSFQGRIESIKHGLLSFLLEQKFNGRKVAAYGAAAKGNTLLNFSGIRSDLLAFVCDAAPSKQGRFLPGSHIPIRAPETLLDERPAWLIVFPWNILDEIVQQNAFIREWGGRFVVAVPHLRVVQDSPQ